MLFGIHDWDKYDSLRPDRLRCRDCGACRL